jgi:Ser/Thr protein kinase RdoA (MazF antagonist)
MLTTTHDPIVLERLAKRLDELFGIGAVSHFAPIEGGYMCQNFDVVAEKGRYFLKQYRQRFSHQVIEVKAAEQFFASHGIPIILPIKDCHGRDTFWFDGSWYSLFPFIAGKNPAAATLTPATVRSLASMLARLHAAGEKIHDAYRFSQLQLWNPEAFELEFIELSNHLQSRAALNATDQAVLDALRHKLAIVRQNRQTPDSFGLAKDRLLHGDFIYQNTFIDDVGEVTHVFDLEKACLGPRAYDVARCLLINCFDHGWTDDNFALGRLFLATYRQTHELSDDEFKRGLQMYLIHIAHMTWMEAKYIIYGSSVYLPMHAAHMERLTKLYCHCDEFCTRVCSPAAPHLDAPPAS